MVSVDASTAPPWDANVKLCGTAPHAKYTCATQGWMMAQTASDYFMKNKSLWSTSHNNQHARHLIQLHLCTTQLFHVTHIHLKLPYTLTLGPQGKHNCVNAQHTHANGKIYKPLPPQFQFQNNSRLVFFHQYNQANV